MRFAHSFCSLRSRARGALFLSGVSEQSARQNFCGVAKKPCSDFHADRSKTVAAKARGALFLRGVSERSERQNFLIAYNLPRTAKNTCAKNHDDRSNDATRRGIHTNPQTNKPMSFYDMMLPSPPTTLPARSGDPATDSVYGPMPVASGVILLRPGQLRDLCTLRASRAGFMQASCPTPLISTLPQL